MNRLKEKYLEIERRKWNNDEKMVKHLEKNFFNAIEVKDGLLVFNKPYIEKWFCYSYDEFQPDTCDMAQRQCEAVRNKFDVFLRANLKDIERWIKVLEGKAGIGDDIRANQDIYIYDTYYDEDGAEGDRIKSWTNDTEDEIKYRFSKNTKYRKAEKDEIEKILEMYYEMRAYMKKRCETYWKRFGGEKLRTWTYSMWD